MYQMPRFPSHPRFTIAIPCSNPVDRRLKDASSAFIGAWVELIGDPAIQNTNSSIALFDGTAPQIKGEPPIELCAVRSITIISLGQLLERLLIVHTLVSRSGRPDSVEHIPLEPL